MALIRWIQKEDVEDVLELHYQAMCEQNSILYQSELEFDLQNLLEVYDQKNGYFCVAVDFPGVIGMGALMIKTGTGAELNHLFVTRAYRGQKIGTKILECLIHQADEKNLPLIQANTLEIMHEAQGLLKKNGFKALKRGKVEGLEYVYFQR